MALQTITVVLFTVFFSEALTLVCYNCTTLSSSECTQNAACTSNSLCRSMTIYSGSSYKLKQCSSGCVNLSISLGLFWMSSQCCSSDLCNKDSVFTASDNEYKCYVCNGTDCSNTLSLKCKGGEDRCIHTTVGSGGKNYTWKGCASQNICDNTTLLKSELLTSPQYSDLTVFSASCCEGNLCNKMTRAVGDLFLLAAVLSLLFSI